MLAGKAATANRTCNTGEIWGEVLAPQCISLALEQLVSIAPWQHQIDNKM